MKLENFAKILNSCSNLVLYHLLLFLVQLCKRSSTICRKYVPYVCQRVSSMPDFLDIFYLLYNRFFSFIFIWFSSENLFHIFIDFFENKINFQIFFLYRIDYIFTFLNLWFWFKIISHYFFLLLYYIYFFTIIIKKSQMRLLCYEKNESWILVEKSFCKFFFTTKLLSKPTISNLIIIKLQETDTFYVRRFLWLKPFKTWF